MSPEVVDLFYLSSACLFVIGLKGLGHPRRAVRGNLLAALGMLLAVVVTLIGQDILRFEAIAAGIATGTMVGVILALRTGLSAMPQLVALFNGLGGGASALVAGSVLLTSDPGPPAAAASAVSGLVGGATFSGSLVAMSKLAGWLRMSPDAPLAQRTLLVLLAIGAVASGSLLVQSPDGGMSYAVLVALASVLGLVLVTPIGGGDMPVVVAFLNACSGLAAAATGFVLMNQALVISGSLVGASGFILTGIMSRAMNRSLTSVLFGRLATASGTEEGEPVNVTIVSPDEVAILLETSRRVVIVPGYGMAVAQAQHAVAELSQKLQTRGVRVDYAIHPVAGRMPGHMNVLLAEAEVPYDELFDLEAINPEMVEADVALVVGANDVVNPSARTDTESPLYGMPIVDVDRARTVVVLKRSLAHGFSQVANPLFSADNAVMLLGDAKQSVVSVTRALSEST